ncbi:MAG: VanZ family protein [Xenococcaceae cyanobacterium]
MSLLKNSTERSTISLRQLLRRSTVGMVVGSFLLVLLMTLFPFNFQIGKDSWQHIFNNVNNLITPGDFLVNIPFFLPWGISLTYLLHNKKLAWQIILPVVFLASAGLSMFVEILQLFLPTRISSPADVAANSLGGVLGWLCFYLLRWTILSRLNSNLVLKWLIASFLGYLVLQCLLSMPLERFATLKVWDKNFPLLIGNENTGDRPFQGYISELLISDRAIVGDRVDRFLSSQSSLVALKDTAIAYYDLNEKGKYLDRTGYLSKLIWQGETIEKQPKQGALFNKKSWLSTAIPATLLQEKIAQTSQFSIFTTVATTDPEQTGPARIISFSGSPLNCNFTIGQDRHNLIFRLKTPLTGDRGTQPEISVPNVFADLIPHRLLFTYANSVVQIYVDTPNKSQRLVIVPGTVLMSYLLPKKSYNINNFMLLYYNFIFIPLGCFLGIIYLYLPEKLLIKILFFICGIILPAFFLEASLTTGQIKNFSANNFVLDLIIIAIAMTIVNLTVRFFYRHINIK